MKTHTATRAKTGEIKPNNKQNNEEQAKTTDITEKTSQRNRQNNEKQAKAIASTMENKTRQWKTGQNNGTPSHNTR